MKHHNCKNPKCTRNPAHGWEPDDDGKYTRHGRSDASYCSGKCRAQHFNDRQLGK